MQETEQEDDDKLVNAIIDLHKEIKGLRGDMDTEMKGLRSEMHEQLAKVNSGLGEPRLSYVKLDKSFNKYAGLNNALIQNHETRISHLEDKSGDAFVAREPKAGYKKGRKNNGISELKVQHCKCCTTGEKSTSRLMDCISHIKIHLHQEVK